MAAQNIYHHIVTVVPFTGAGTYKDPKRPMYAPNTAAAGVSPAAVKSGDRTGILGFTFLASDDGKSAIVEFVGTSPTVLSSVYNDKTLKIYVRGKDPDATIESAMQVYRKNFSLKNFGVPVR